MATYTGNYTVTTAYNSIQVTVPHQSGFNYYRVFCRKASASTAATDSYTSASGSHTSTFTAEPQTEYVIRVRYGVDSAGYSETNYTLWFSSGSETKSVTTPAQPVSSTVTWSFRRYTDGVYYDDWGGSAQVQAGGNDGGTTKPFLKLDAPSGYYFDHADIGGVTVLHNDNTTEIITYPYTDFTLDVYYLHKLTIGLRVTFDANGGTGAPGDLTPTWQESVQSKSETVTLPATPVPTRTNYAFQGWLINGSTVQPGGTVTLTASTSTPTYTATAQWQKTTVTMTQKEYKDGVLYDTATGEVEPGGNDGGAYKVFLKGFAPTGYYFDHAEINGVTVLHGDNTTEVLTYPNADFTLDVYYVSTGGAFVWDGSAWKRATPYVWDGTQWKAATANVWDGSGWES